jgi:hypothetical protein
MKPALPPVPPPLFTLRSALRWLGYDDQSRHCPQPIDVLPTSVWFLRRQGQQVPNFPLETLVIVEHTDTGAPAALIRQMVEDINRCIGHDLIVLSRQCDMASRFNDPVAPVALHPDDRATGRCAARRPGHTSRTGTRSLPHLRPYALLPAPTTPIADLQRLFRT